MKRLTVFLAGTTFLFSGSTLYLFLKLQQERSRSVLARQSVSGSSIRPAASHDVPGNAGDKSAPAATTGTLDDVKSPGESTTEKAANKAARLAVARNKLEQLRDRAGRAEQNALIAGLLRPDLQELVDHLHLSSSETAQFLNALAERTTVRTQQMLECELTSPCDTDALRESLKPAREQDMAEVLGPERYARYQAFQATYGERQHIFWLNMQLPPDAKLTAAQSERLVSAWASLRKQFDDDAARRGDTVQQYMSQLRSAAPTGSVNERSQRLESARRYVQDQYDRAAAILDPEQLTRLKAELDTSLAEYKSDLKREEILSSAKGSAASTDSH